VNTLTSKDGTTIAFDEEGDGPALILVDGATSTRSSGSKFLYGHSSGGCPALDATVQLGDAGIMGKNGSIPTERASRVHVPTLVMSGGDGAPFMLETARKLSTAIPVAKLSTLDGQTHDVHPEALAPALVEFFAG
jgi:pimeloyl-ACP methyl ester carboxylesterase